MIKELEENNYIYIPNFISESHAKQLAKNFKHYCETNSISGDEQIPESMSFHNYIDFLELLCNGVPNISEFIGEQVLPTYTYSRVYKNGAELHRHRDRDACEISVTLHLDGDSEWPILIQKPNGEEASLNLKSGDAMIYLGCVADHWREKFSGQEYIQVFLHYVRSRGERAYTYFDRVRDHEREAKNRPKIETKNDNSAAPLISLSKNLEDYIVIYENIIPDSLCDRIIKEYEGSNSWYESTIGTGILDKEKRNVNEIGISCGDIISKNPEIRKKLDEEIFECANKAIQKYNEKFPYAVIEQDSGYQLLRYNKGQFYKQHTDSYKQHPRAVSCSFALNDDFEGGEFAFFNQELKYSLKKGSVIMFPSNFMYPHEICEVRSGVRYSIITWFV